MYLQTDSIYTYAIRSEAIFDPPDHYQPARIMSHDITIPAFLGLQPGSPGQADLEKEKGNAFIAAR